MIESSGKKKEKHTEVMAKRVYTVESIWLPNPKPPFAFAQLSCSASPPCSTRPTAHAAAAGPLPELRLELAGAPSTAPAFPLSACSLTCFFKQGENGYGFSA